MKFKNYEELCSPNLLTEIPVIARIDGRCFHTFCEGLERPFDPNLSELMIQTAAFLVGETNALIAYTQSDEISLLWQHNVFFNGRVLKMASILGALTSSFFNEKKRELLPVKESVLATFDARVFNVPNREEALEYFLWREDDATKNSISMAAQNYFHHKSLMNKKRSELQEMLFQVGVNWNDYPTHFKRGTYIGKIKVEKPFSQEEIEKLPEKHIARSNPNLVVERSIIVRHAIPPLGKHNGIEFLFGESQRNT